MAGCRHISSGLDQSVRSLAGFRKRARKGRRLADFALRAPVRTRNPLNQ